jgi:lysozyme
MKPSINCFTSIKRWESLHRQRSDGMIEAYWDADGKVWTIGWGNTFNPFTKGAVSAGQTITKETADQWLEKDVESRSKYVNDNFDGLNQNQFDALVSMTYNTGVFGDGLTALLKAKVWDSAAKKMLEYNKSNGVYMEGLQNRRNAEVELFRKPMAAVPVVEKSQTPTWFEFTRNEKGETVLISYAGETSISLLTTKDSLELAAELTKFGRHNVEVAPAGKVIPYIPGSGRGGEITLKLTRTGRKTSWGCDELKLAFVQGETVLAFVYATSGKKSAQVFQKGGPENHPGSMMPLPQGEYDVGPLEWKIKDDYSGSWGAGLGPTWNALTPKFKTDRSAFGAHVDNEYDGTAGCCGLSGMDELKKFVGLYEKYKPKTLTVDWGIA